MPLTFLQGVNEALKRVGLIQGDAGALTSFTDSARQIDIDVMIQTWNETIQLLYEFGVKPQEVAESTFTLVASTREYTLATDFEGFVTDPLDETNGNKLLAYPGGYVQMTEDQLIPANYTGRPIYYAVNPQNGKIRLDTAPTAAEASEIYTYRYTKDLEMSLIADTYPFSDQVARNLYSAVAQLWSFNRKESWNPAIFNKSMTLALKTLNVHESRDTY